MYMNICRYMYNTYKLIYIYVYIYIYIQLQPMLFTTAAIFVGIAFQPVSKINMT